jgi:uncharacterized protein (DUF1501 family)
MSHSDDVFSRRDWFRLSAAGVVGYSMSGWLENLAAAAANNPQRRRACILLWMAGGPSQMDTFDLKPEHDNGGPYKEIATSVPGIKISEHLPKLAQHMKEMVLVRSMSTKEADHGRATYFLRTGRVPGGPVQYPPLGSFVSKELERPDAELPGFVSIAPFRFLNPAAYTPGFLGPQYAPLVVGESAQGPLGPQGQNNIERILKVQDLDLAADVSARRSAARIQMLDEMEQEFLAQHTSVAAQSHRTAYQRAITMMRSSAVKAFNLEEEPAKLRDSYGRNLFGQGCLLARRLVERGVPFVEVSLNGWDTHNQNFEQVKRLSETLDPAWATLMTDLKDKGLLDSTLVVWMGEFGRTPKIAKERTGRDHWAVSWSSVLAGGGIKGGQVVGKTSADGTTVEDHPVNVPDLLGTICLALGLDPRKQNNSNVGRPIRLVEPTAKPINGVVV